MMSSITDTHFHLDFVDNPASFASAADAAGLALLAVSVTPAGYRRIRETCGNFSNVHPAVGLHPWWVADGRATEADLAMLDELVSDTRYVGEVGLDLSPRHVPPGSEARQVAAFERVCQACADAGGNKVLSIHSVRAAGTVLDVLTRTGAIGSCRCVFHWFSGSSEEIWRAIRADCWFSVNEMMLSTGRGREYVRLIPRDRLLLETDQPAGKDIPWNVDRVMGSLVSTLGRLEQALSRDVTAEVQANAEVLLS